MLPFKSLIEIDKNNSKPIYLQIVNQFIDLIRQGILKPGTKLPGSRKLSDILGIHRKTVIAAFDELYAQSWLEVIPHRGTFVNQHLPETKTTSLIKGKKPFQIPEKPGYPFDLNTILTTPFTPKNNLLEINEGYPDVRIAPLKELAANYRAALHRKPLNKHLYYLDCRGNEELRIILSDYLNNTRGLSTTSDNILLTNGSIMAIYLAIQSLVKNGDKVIVGETNYRSANIAFQLAGAIIQKVKVDEEGIVVEEIEKICQKHPIRMIYVTPHHHHPTTVTLKAERRMKLLQLAEKYGFIILEDDYDYDFHYDHNPLLPLASADKYGMVIYTGSLCKTIAPAIRVGYMVGPKVIIDEIAMFRRFIDRQGDHMLELAIAQLFKEGIIQRHLKKALKLFHQRRDNFAKLLVEKMGDKVQFKLPEGGMAIWTIFDKAYPLNLLIEKAYHKGLYIPPYRHFSPDEKDLNATRLGFASLNQEEMEQIFEILSSI
ncbi:PLP-dependent aminotransferase family protein [Flexithrix dorotheae]|uniref:aminotransferase-like domain-containing protein n=1 Tax=Flexithrix dorotheae TaxID=70993 RepID=UPI0003797D7F|nr:PLP-dependent aminotransferase family protein [Flexithrix dorotheae]